MPRATILDLFFVIPLVTSLVVTVSACGGTPAAGAPPPRAAEPSTRTIERYFPLEEGRIYEYVTHDGAETGMLVARVNRGDATHGELRLSNATKRFVFAADGVAYDGGAYILKTPLEVGSSWPGEHGGTTKITSVDADVRVPAGAYTSCIQTVEEGGRVPGARYATVYCPGVGMVSLEITAPTGKATAELKSYGFPVKIQ